MDEQLYKATYTENFPSLFSKSKNTMTLNFFSFITHVDGHFMESKKKNYLLVSEFASHLNILGQYIFITCFQLTLS